MKRELALILVYIYSFLTVQSIVRVPSEILPNLNQFIKNNVSNFDVHYINKCGSNRVPQNQEWSTSNICVWKNFSEWGNFHTSDFRMIPPRHLRKISIGLEVIFFNWKANNFFKICFQSQLWVEDARDTFLQIPVDFCFVTRDGYYSWKGLLFDCKNQYPLLVKRNRKDLDISLSATPRNSKVYCHDGPLYSVEWPYNGAFSHSLSVGASIAVYILANMAKDRNSKIIIRKFTSY